MSRSEATSAFRKRRGERRPSSPEPSEGNRFETDRDEVHPRGRGPASDRAGADGVRRDASGPRDRRLQGGRARLRRRLPASAAGDPRPDPVIQDGGHRPPQRELHHPPRDEGPDPCVRGGRGVRRLLPLGSSAPRVRRGAARGGDQDLGTGRFGCGGEGGRRPRRRPDRRPGKRGGGSQLRVAADLRPRPLDPRGGLSGSRPGRGRDRDGPTGRRRARPRRGRRVGRHAIRRQRGGLRPSRVQEAPRGGSGHGHPPLLRLRPGPAAVQSDARARRRPRPRVRLARGGGAEGPAVPAGRRHDEARGGDDPPPPVQQLRPDSRHGGTDRRAPLPRGAGRGACPRGGPRRADRPPDDGRGDLRVGFDRDGGRGWPLRGRPNRRGEVGMKRAGRVLLLVAGGAAAAAQDDPHAACAAPPSNVPAELLERPVSLRKGIGNSRETVSTTSAEAQAFHDQGLNYLESYVWIEAARSFHQAVRLDGGMAMGWLGLSYASSGLDDSGAAKRFFEKAKSLATGAGERERRRIEIREKQLVAIDALEDAGAFLAYKKAIDDALAADLENPQLWLLRGTAEEPNAAGRGQRGTASSAAFYEKVLKLVPDHASAHHYLVHSYETIGRIDKALEHGEAYARLAPSIPHAAHMWGHDLRRVGRIDEAIAQFRKADALERAYYEAEGIEPGFDWHHGHNLGLLATCFEHKGQMRLAETTMREAASLGAFGVYRAFARLELPNFLIHRGRYAEALEEASALAKTDYPQSRAVGHALAGQALLRLGRTDEAAAALESARKELGDVPRVTPGVVPRRANVEPWVDSLRGDLLLRTGKTEEGRAVLEEVQRALRAIPGPDAWTQTLFRLETIARGAIEAGDWDLAEHTAAQMLDHDAAYGGSHLAMALVLRNKGDAAGAARELEAARRDWRDADRDPPERAQIARAAGPAR